MERLRKSAKTAEDVNRVLKESNLFRDVGLSGPVSLTEALRMDMSCLAETPATIGCPSTAWWWFVEDFYRPIGRHDMLKLLPQEDELDPSTDRCFRMPPLGPPEGRRTLTECWESFGYTTLRKERRSGRLAEKRAFSSGLEVPSAPGADWLELPKEFLKTQKNALELCKDDSIVGQLDKLLDDLDVTSSTEQKEPSQFVRYQTIHPLTEMMLDQAKNDDRMDISEDDNPSQDPDHPFSSHCLSIGPDDEIVAEILKLQDNLFGQMVTNRITARRLSKAALRSSKREQKEAMMREQKENEIVKCMKIIEAHEKKKSEKRAAEKAESRPPVESPPRLKKETREEKPLLTLPPQDLSQPKLLTTKPPPTPTVVPSSSQVDKKILRKKVEEVKSRTCEICGASDSISNLLVCEHCGIAVHQSCYPNAKTPVSESANWYCLPCQIYHERQKGIPMKSTALKSGGALSVECKVCLNSGGAFERTPDKKWIHSVCQLAITEGNLTGSVQTRRRCTLCDKAKGKVLPCTQKNCTSFLHPSCAKEKGTLVIKRKTKKNDKPCLVIESMTCGQCNIVEPNKILDEAPSFTSEQGVQDRRSPVSGTKKKRKLLHKSESIIQKEDYESDDEAKESVSRSTRSKTKPMKTEAPLLPPTEFKAAKPQKKTDSSSLPPHSKKIKKIKKVHQTSVTGKQLQSSLPEATKSALPNLDKNKKYRITRSRK